MRNQFALEWSKVVAIVVILEVFGKYFALFGHPSLGYDKILHFLAGGACGIFGVALLFCFPWWDIFGVLDPLCDVSTRDRRIWLFAIASAITIGVSYEVAQAYLPWLRDASDYDWYDTIGDVIFDTMGGVVAGWRYRSREQ